MKKAFKTLFIDKSATIKDALRQMDALSRRLLIVTENNKFLSLVSIGDIQRAIIKENKLDIPINQTLRESVKVAFEHDDINQIKAQMRVRRNEFMPVISKDGKIKNVLFWEDLLREEERIQRDDIDLPIVIMAGGKGTRLRPITNVLPKALIPIGEKTIMERIMDSFLQMGSNRFYVSVNHKAEMIDYYFKKLNHPDYCICFFNEEKPLGTAGSLSLLKGKINEPFFVSNCDILIDQDYGEILRYHESNKNEITLVAAMKSYPIPYGVIYTRENGLLDNIEEKPELSFKINTGFYILEPHLLAEIPDNKFYHITELVEKIRLSGRRVGVFPVSEKSWVDIGTWSDYLSNHTK